MGKSESKDGSRDLSALVQLQQKTIDSQQTTIDRLTKKMLDN